VSSVDVVVVSYNSRAHLRRCVAPLAGCNGVRPIVVDNASPDRAHETVRDLPVTIVELPTNGGFSAGCNAGWRAGAAPYVLFLNPDSRLEPEALERLVSAVEGDRRAGAAAPRIVGEDGELNWSQRRFPHLASIWAQALYLHRIFPRASWVDELVRDRAAYERPGSPDWASGACLLVRREVLERLGGFDDRFFMYWEDTDLCRRIRALGLEVRYEPAVTLVHAGGASAPRSSLLPVLAESRLRYVRKHHGRLRAALERVGVAFAAATHAAAAPTARGGHLRSLVLVLKGLDGRGA
jgi:N-acetylglucosaminyl-diphospho-decaprenol L-rhamnosyltransferase